MTEEKCQPASLESRGGDDVPAKCGEKSVHVIVAQLSVGVDKLSDIVYKEDVMPSQDMSVAWLRMGVDQLSDIVYEAKPG